MMAAAPASAKMHNSKSKIAIAKALKTTIEQAIAKAVEKVPGKAIEVELGKKAGKPVWEVEVLTEDGSVHEVDVDATTGEVIDSEKKGGAKKKAKKAADKTESEAKAPAEPKGADAPPEEKKEE